MKAVAIDGPAGAGKSTISRITAKKLGFIYVDTGALYRTVGYAMDSKNVSVQDTQGVKNALKDINIELKFIDNEQRVFLNGEDVSDKIRTPKVSMLASDFSALSPVREFLFDLQRDIAKKQNVIMDGRDIGTLVLPNADIKIFLTATPEDRAKRRYNEFVEKGVPVEFDKLLEEIKQRDYNDSHRAVAPLKQADDALLVDTTGNTLEESINLLFDIISKRLGL